MAIAQLSVDLVANLGRFEADMARATRSIDTLSKRIGSFRGLGEIAIGSALGAGVAEASRQLVNLYPNLINNVAAFQDLEEKTGGSAVALASFQTAADVASVSSDQIAAAMNRLTVNLSKVDDESKGAGKAVAALGLDFETFKALSPDNQIEAVANALANFEGRASKSAVAIALFGKAGADLLPFLKELASTGRSQIALTAEQIRQADDFADRQARLKSEIRQLAQITSVQALPAFSALAEEFGKAARAGFELNRVGNDLQRSNAVESFAQDAAIALATVGEAAVGTVKAIAIIPSAFRAAAADLEVLSAAAGKINPVARAIDSVKGNTESLSDVLKRRNETVAQFNRELANLLSYNGTAISDALRDRFARGQGRLDSFNDPRSTLFQQRPLPRLEFTGTPDRPDRPRESRPPRVSDEAQRYLQNLQRQLEGTENLTAAQQALRDIESDRIEGLNPALREQILLFAGLLDQAKQRTQLLADEQAAREGAARLSAQAFEATVRETAESIELNEQLREEIRIISGGEEALRAIERARISAAIATKQQALAQFENAGATEAETQAIRQQIELLRQRTGLLDQRDEATGEALRLQDQTVAAERFVDVLAQGAGDAVLNFRDLSSVLKGVEQQLLQLGTQELVIEPARDFLKGVFKPGAGGFAEFVGSLFGFDAGGYTGNGGTGEPAGIVHGREFVFSAKAVEQLGVGFLQNLHDGAKVGRFKGYQSGGYVYNGTRTAPSSERALVVHNSFTIEGPTDKRTEGQIAAAAARGITRAMARGHA